MIIIVSKNRQNAKTLEPVGFEQEHSLQEYIHNNPESIPLYELNEDKKLFIIAREFSSKSGPIDAIGIDKDGDVYIIETKLYKNPDKRTVIAQALDYGASLWRHNIDFELLLEKFNEKVQKKFDVPFIDKVRNSFILNNEEVDILLDNIRRNFNEGNFKFIILMDTIEERLRDLILYVNQNSKFDIYGVQFQYYNIDDYEIIITKIFGVNIKKDIAKPKAKIKWNKSLFVEEVKNTGLSSFVNIVNKIINWAEKEQLPIKWGSGAKQGTFFPCIAKDGEIFSLFGVYSTGKIEIDFQSLPFDNETKKKILLCLNQLSGVNIPEKALQTWKSFSMSSLGTEEGFKQFIQCFENVMKHR